MACLEEDLIWVLQHFPLDDELSDGYNSEELLYLEEVIQVDDMMEEEAIAASADLGMSEESHPQAVEGYRQITRSGHDGLIVPNGEDSNTRREPIPHSIVSMAANVSPTPTHIAAVLHRQAEEEHRQTTRSGWDGYTGPKGQDFSAHREPKPHSTLGIAANDAPTPTHIPTGKRVSNVSASPASYKQDETGHLQTTMSRQDEQSIPKGEKLTTGREPIPHSTLSVAATDSPTPTTNTTGKRLNILLSSPVPYQQAEAGHLQTAMSRQDGQGTPKQEDPRAGREPIHHSTLSKAASDTPTQTHSTKVPLQQAKAAQLQTSGQGGHAASKGDEPKACKEPTPLSTIGMAAKDSTTSSAIKTVSFQQVKAGQIQTPMNEQGRHASPKGDEPSTRQESTPHSTLGMAVNDSPTSTHIATVSLQQAKAGYLQTTMSGQGGHTATKGQEPSARRESTLPSTLGMAANNIHPSAHIATESLLQAKAVHLQTTMSGQVGHTATKGQEPSAHREPAPHSTLGTAANDIPTSTHIATVSLLQAKAGHLQTTMNGEGGHATTKGQEPSACREPTPHSTLGTAANDIPTSAHIATVSLLQANAGYLQPTMSGQGGHTATKGQEPSARGEPAPHSTLGMAANDIPPSTHMATVSSQQSKAGHLQTSMSKQDRYAAPKREEPSAHREPTHHSRLGMAANDSPTLTHIPPGRRVNILLSAPVSHQQAEARHVQTNMCRWDEHAAPQGKDPSAYQEPITCTFNMAGNYPPTLIRITTGAPPVDDEAIERAAQPSAQIRKKRVRKPVIPDSSSSSTEEEETGPFRSITPPASPALTFKTSSRDSDYVSATGDDVEPGEETTSPARSDLTPNKSNSSESSTEVESEHTSTDIFSAGSRGSSARQDTRAQLQATVVQEEITDLLGKIAAGQDNMLTTLKDLEARKEGFRKDMLNKQEDIVDAIQDNSEKVKEFTTKLGNQHMELMSLMTFWCLQMLKSHEAPADRGLHRECGTSLIDIVTFLSSRQFNANEPGPSTLPSKKPGEH